MSLAYAGDTPTHRCTIEEMDEPAFTAFLEGIRVRRLEALATYQKAQALKGVTSTQTQYDKLVKLCNKMHKKLDTIEKDCQALEKMHQEYRIMKLELEA